MINEMRFSGAALLAFKNSVAYTLICCSGRQKLIQTAFLDSYTHIHMIKDFYWKSSGRTPQRVTHKNNKILTKHN